MAYFNNNKEKRDIKEYSYIKIPNSDNFYIFTVFLFSEPIKTFIAENIIDFNLIDLTLQDYGFKFVDLWNTKPVDCIEKQHIRLMKNSIYGSTCGKCNSLELNGFLLMNHASTMRLEDRTNLTLKDLEQYTLGNQTPEKILELTKLVKENLKKAGENNE